MILLLLSIYITDYDFSLTQDKIGHFGIGYATSSISYFAFTSIGNNSNSDNISSAIALSALIGVWKEGYDYNRTGKASLGDLTYTIIGGIVGAIISNWLFNGG